MTLARLEHELDDLIRSMEHGGLGCPDAERQFERKIEHLRFKIGRRDKVMIAIYSAVVGGFSGRLLRTC